LSGTVLAMRTRNAMSTPLKILSPLDLGESSFTALRVAEQIAKGSGGTIYLLHVVPADEFALLQEKYRPWESGGPDVDAACEVARRQLEQTARERIGSRVPYEVMTRVGDAAEMVLSVEKELDADLLVIGRERSTPTSAGLRSVFLDRLLNDSFCPVLMLPRACEDAGSFEIHIGKHRPARSRRDDK
jgi:nucleotide-binding universal stress UspA family protein